MCELGVKTACLVEHNVDIIKGIEERHIKIFFNSSEDLKYSSVLLATNEQRQTCSK